MDWNLFWNAFGAIGTTIGSLITAGAVVVAVKQYKQPLKKIVKVEFTSVMSIGEPLNFYCISIKNKGVRVVQINSLCVQGKNKNLWINNSQFNSNAKVILPVKIEPEENIDILFEVYNFRHAIKQAVNDNILRRRQRLVVFVIDSLGENYFCKTNISIGRLIKDL